MGRSGPVGDLTGRDESILIFVVHNFHRAVYALFAYVCGSPVNGIETGALEPHPKTTSMPSWYGPPFRWGAFGRLVKNPRLSSFHLLAHTAEPQSSIVY